MTLPLMQLQTFSEPSGTSKMELFAKIINGYKPLTISAKSSILEVRVSLHPSFQELYTWSAHRMQVLFQINYVQNKVNQE